MSRLDARRPAASKDGDGGRDSNGSAFAAALAEIRSDARARRSALALGAIVGLAVAWVHWYGFLLGGALVGLVSKDGKHAVLAGVAFGLLAWVGFVGLLASHGALVEYAAMGRVLYVSAAIPVVASTLGSLVRGVV